MKTEAKWDNNSIIQDGEHPEDPTIPIVELEIYNGLFTSSIDYIGIVGNTKQPSLEKAIALPKATDLFAIGRIIRVFFPNGQNYSGEISYFWEFSDINNPLIILGSGITTSGTNSIIDIKISSLKIAGKYNLKIAFELNGEETHKLITYNHYDKCKNGHKDRRHCVGEGSCIEKKLFFDSEIFISTKDFCVSKNGISVINRKLFITYDYPKTPSEDKRRYGYDGKRLADNGMPIEWLDVALKDASTVNNSLKALTETIYRRGWKYYRPKKIENNTDPTVILPYSLIVGKLVEYKIIENKDTIYYTEGGNCGIFAAVLMELAQCIGIEASTASLQLGSDVPSPGYFMMIPGQKALDGTINATNIKKNYEYAWIFSEHALVVYNNKYYDPTLGLEGNKIDEYVFAKQINVFDGSIYVLKEKKMLGKYIYVKAVNADNQENNSIYTYNVDDIKSGIGWPKFNYWYK